MSQRAIVVSTEDGVAAVYVLPGEVAEREADYYRAIELHAQEAGVRVNNVIVREVSNYTALYGAMKADFPEE